jgi:hypothetical protein
MINRIQRALLDLQRKMERKLAEAIIEDAAKKAGLNNKGSLR